MPSEAATSSPSWRRLSPGVLAAARSRPSRMNGSTCQKTDMSRPADGADHPEPVLVEGVGVPHDDRGRDGAEERAHGGAREHQRDRVGAAPGRADREHGGRREAGSGEGEPHVAAQRPPRRTRRSPMTTAQRRAGLDAEQAGVGQRVAGVTLHQRAGDAERHADGDGEHGARDAQRVHDGRGLGPVVVEQDVEHRPGGERPAADGQAGHPAEHHQRQQHDQESYLVASRHRVDLRGPCQPWLVHDRCAHEVRLASPHRRA